MRLRPGVALPSGPGYVSGKRCPALEHGDIGEVEEDDGEDPEWCRFRVRGPRGTTRMYREDELEVVGGTDCYWL